MVKDRPSLARLEEIMSEYFSSEDIKEIPQQLLTVLRSDQRSGAKKLYARWCRKKEKFLSEKRRFSAMFIYEKKAYSLGRQLVAGIDEVGRGSLAGPLMAAAVILPPYTFIPGLRDSKQLSPPARYRLEKKIKEVALTWSLGTVSAVEVDTLGISKATRRAMMAAIRGLKVIPEQLIIDAVRLPDAIQPQISLIKGDRLSASVAAASILAKTERDRRMIDLEAKYPGYGFAKNKGYGTREHLEALFLYGPSAEHRKTFIAGYKFRTS